MVWRMSSIDACNVQYYLFCEGVFKPATGRSRCPPPTGYPDHCCYSTAVPQRHANSLPAGGKQRQHSAPRPAKYLLSVYPPQPTGLVGTHSATQLVAPES